MKRPTLLLALVFTVLWTGAGCNNKIKKYADKIQSMSVYQATSATRPSVDLGHWDLPLDDKGNPIPGETAESVANAVIDAFSIELAGRVDREINPERLTEALVASATDAMNQRGPYPVDPQSRWQLQLTLFSYGLDGGVHSDATAFVAIDAEVFGPKGKRIWRRQVSCADRVGPSLPSGGVAQTAVNMAALAKISDRELRSVFDSVADRCGAEVVDHLRQTVSRAK